MINKTTLVFLIVLLYASKGIAEGIDTLKIYSPEMAKDVPALVMTPENDSVEKDYPVLYLLHGYSGNESSWLDISPELQEYVNTYQMIVVMPDGGYGSWYLDSPVDDDVRYESFMTKTMVPTIDSLYNTQSDREHRGIAGLSMGGHGALYLTIKHQDLFGAVASISGGVDIRPFPDNWGIKKVLGNIETHKENWENNSIINMVEILKNEALQIFIDDGIDDIFIHENRALHQKLIELGINHDYIERPGGHTAEYWRKVLPYNMLFFKEFFYPQEG